MNEKRLELLKIFKEIFKMDYVIVKHNENFPNYEQKSDLDIFVKDIDEFVKKLLAILKLELGINDSLRVSNKDIKHIHIDYICEGDLDLRFDIYGQNPWYEKLNIKLSFLSGVIDRSEQILIKNGKFKTAIKIPDKIDDLIIRYAEYLEYYEARPDKLKHLNYVYEKLELLEKVEKKEFFRRLHLYTDLPKSTEKIKSSYFFNKYFSTIKFYYYRIKQMGVSKLMSKIYHKLIK